MNANTEIITESMEAIEGMGALTPKMLEVIGVFADGFTEPMADTTRRRKFFADLLEIEKTFAAFRQQVPRWAIAACADAPSTDDGILFLQMLGKVRKAATDAEFDGFLQLLPASDRIELEDKFDELSTVARGTDARLN